MQISNLPPPPQALGIGSTHSCGGTVAIIACAVFTAIIVSSALVLANVIALSIPIALLIVAIAISALALGRLCCYIHKSLCVSSKPLSAPSVAQEELIEDSLTSDEKQLVASLCSCAACSFKPGNVLNQDEQLVLNAWSKGFFRNMNACMAKENDNPNIKHINQIAIKALSKLPAAPNQQSLVRGADFNDQRLTELYPVGQKFTLDRFMSTTIRESLLPSVVSTMNTIFYVQGITGKSIKLYCHFKEEEVLFAPGTQFLTTQIKLESNPKQVFLEEVAPEAIL